MSQTNHDSQQGFPPFLPGLILIGIFAVMMAILTPRVDSSASAPTRTSAAAAQVATILPTATASIVPATVMAAETLEIAQTPTPANALTAIALGASLGRTSETAVPVPTLAPTNILTAIAVGASSNETIPALAPTNILTAIASGASVTSPTLAPTSEASIVPTVAPIEPTTPPIEPTIAAPAESISADPARAAEGQTLFSTTCSACHGYDAHGIPGLGKDLVTSPFVHGLSDADLLHFIIIGRDASDPANTTGIMMPAKGGNSSLTDDQILAIIAYLRSIASN